MRLSPQPPKAQQTLMIPQDTAVYRIKEGKFFGPDDHLYEEGAVIALEDGIEPNQEMEPLNDKAVEAMKIYLAKLDALGRKVAQKTGKAWNSLGDAFENARALEMQESKKVRLLNGAEQKTLMGGKKKAGRVTKIELDQPAPLLGNQGISKSDRDVLNNK